MSRLLLVGGVRFHMVFPKFRDMSWSRIDYGAVDVFIKISHLIVVFVKALSADIFIVLSLLTRLEYRELAIYYSRSLLY